MSRYCPKPECGLIPLDTDTEILLHILEHQVTLELKMADLTALNTAADAIIAKLAASETDQAGVDAVTAKLNDAVNPPAAAPVESAPIDPSQVVDPSTGLLPDGTQPTA